MSGWSINPGIWLGKRICCDNLWTKNVYQLFLFLFIFHSMLFSVKLQLSNILWAHVELRIYLGMPEHLVTNIRLYVLLSWLSVQIQTNNEINSFSPIDWELLLLPAIIPEKGFSQIWCLYRKIHVLSKINDKIFKNCWKIPFLGHFWPFFGHFCPNQIFL